MPSEALSVLSTAIGWGYFLAWSISFYPQVILNFKRKSVVGLSFDFLLYNLLGFACYSSYVLVNFIEQHRLGLTQSVQPNDIAFAFHALLMSSINALMVFCFERGKQKLSQGHSTIVAILVSILIYTVILAASGFVPWYTSSDATYNFSVVDMLGYTKAFISFVKYTPQVYLNWRLQSTQGWAIGNVLLDLTGGLLSFFQQFIDAINQDNWGNVTSNLPKLILALESIMFDLIFIFQHFCLYRNRPISTFTSLYTPIGDSADADDHQDGQAQYGSDHRADRR